MRMQAAILVCVSYVGFSRRFYAGSVSVQYVLSMSLNPLISTAVVCLSYHENSEYYGDESRLCHNEGSFLRMLKPLAIKEKQQESALEECAWLSSWSFINKTKLTLARGDRIGDSPQQENKLGRIKRLVLVTSTSGCVLSWILQWHSVPALWPRLRDVLLHWMLITFLLISFH